MHMLSKGHPFLTDKALGPGGVRFRGFHSTMYYHVEDLKFELHFSIVKL